METLRDDGHDVALAERALDLGPGDTRARIGRNGAIVADLVAATRAAGHVPLVLGGDCLVAIGIIEHLLTPADVHRGLAEQRPAARATVPAPPAAPPVWINQPRLERQGGCLPTNIRRLGESKASSTRERRAPDRDRNHTSWARTPEEMTGARPLDDDASRFGSRIAFVPRPYTLISPAGSSRCPEEEASYR